MTTVYQIKGNNLEVIDVSSKFDLVERYADAVLDSEKFLKWESNVLPLQWIRGIRVKPSERNHNERGLL